MIEKKSDEEIDGEEMDEESLSDLLDKMDSQAGTDRKLTDEEIKSYLNKIIHSYK